VEICVIAKNEAIYVIIYFTIIINTRRLFGKGVFLYFRKFLEIKPLIYLEDGKKRHAYDENIKQCNRYHLITSPA
jgi:hypothetical protein